MVLDAKALAWAAQHDIDTAKLKKARVPIYGKWYFPEIPARVPLISLQTGERRTFDERMIAGEVIWVAEADLARAGLLPTEALPGEGESPERSTTALAERPPEGEARAPLAFPTEEAPEPFLAMARPPGLEQPTPGTVSLPIEELPSEAVEPPPAGIHLPSPSIGPFVLGIGFSLVFFGLITHVLILVTGLLWMLVGAIVWIRAGMLEDQMLHAHGPETAP